MMRGASGDECRNLLGARIQ